MPRLPTIGYITLMQVVLGGILGPQAACGGTIWQWTHEASGSGWAHLFDGGPIVYGSASTEGPDDPTLLRSACDRAGVGAGGASYCTAFSSYVLVEDSPVPEGLLNLRVDFNTSYLSSFEVGGPRPGGEGGGELHSVIEFIMPRDQLDWLICIDVQADPGFSGSTHLLLENVTQGVTIFEASSSYYDEEATLLGRRGDLMRMTTDISGEGRVEPNRLLYAHYDADIIMYFRIPEPTTLALMLMGSIVWGIRTVVRRG